MIQIVRRWAGFVKPALLLFWPALALGGSFTVTPVRVELSSTQRSVAMTVKNNGEAAAVIQIRVLAWSQPNGKDEFAPTDDIIATPPIVTIPSGASQVVRFGLRREPDANLELAYRVFLQETPGPPQPGFQGLQLALRLSVPIFVETKAATQRMNWSAFSHPGGGLGVRLENAGQKHVQVFGISLARAGREGPGYAAPNMVYVLPGESHLWQLLPTDERGAAIAVGERLRLTAGSDAGDVDTELLVEQR
jgi:fimbrial chaperone protein